MFALSTFSSLKASRLGETEQVSTEMQRQLEAFSSLKASRLGETHHPLSAGSSPASLSVLSRRVVWVKLQKLLREYFFP